MPRFAPPFATIFATLPLAALAIAAAPVTAADVAVSSQGPVIELNVTENVEAKPDIAEIGAGVTTQAESATEAMRANARAMNQVVDRIRALGIEPDDVQTAGINLSPIYDYDQAQRQQVFRGYQASNRVSVTLRDIARTGEVLDALVAAGATDLSGPSWSIDDPAAAQAQARERAFATARERAQQYAQMAGYKGIRLLQIGEAVPMGRPVPMQVTARAAMADESTPVLPGQVQTGVSISVTYEMVN